MAHRRNGTPHARSGLDADTAQSVASILQGLATPSRLHLLDHLRHGPLTVGELTDAVGMEQSAVSHQLRHLRELGFVIAERQGRHVAYRLFDDHIVDLIDQAMSHAEHLRLAGAQEDRPSTATSHKEPSS